MKNDLSLRVQRQAGRMILSSLEKKSALIWPQLVAGSLFERKARCRLIGMNEVDHFWLYKLRGYPMKTSVPSTTSCFSRVVLYTFFVLSAATSFAQTHQISAEEILKSKGHAAVWEKAQTGDPASLNRVGSILFAENRQQEGLQWLIKASEAGDKRSPYVIALAYMMGQGVPKKDMKEAVKWLTIAAERGEANSLYRLAAMYEQGHEVDKDKALAAKYWLKGAELGDLRMMLAVALKYMDGRGGFSKDPVESTKWMKAVAEKDLSAAWMLGNAYKNGFGTAKDEVQALKWYKAGAENGDPLSMFEYAEATQRGVGADKNPVDAYIWNSVIVATSDNASIAANGKKQKELLQTQLKPEELTQADQAAATRIEAIQKIIASRK